MTRRQQHVLIGFYFTKPFKILSDMPFKLKGEPNSFVYYKYPKHWLYNLAVTNDCKLQIFTTRLRSCTTSNIYCKVASINACYKFKKTSFVKRPQYIGIKNLLHNQSEEA